MFKKDYGTWRGLGARQLRDQSFSGGCRVSRRDLNIDQAEPVSQGREAGRLD
jgi:hypothetical protein